LTGRLFFINIFILILNNKICNLLTKSNLCNHKHINSFSQYSIKDKILYMVMEKGDTDLSKLIRSTKHMSVHMIMYYWTEMLTTVSEIHAKGK